MKIERQKPGMITLFYILLFTRKINTMTFYFLVKINVFAFLVAQMVKNLPAIRETQVRFLSREDPLEKEWQPTPVFLPGKSHGQKSLKCYSPWGLQRVGHD